MSLSSHSSNRPRETKISYFIDRFTSLLLLKQNIFRFNIPVNEIFLVYAFQTFKYLNKHAQRLLDSECLSRQPSLIGEQVSLVAVLKNDENEVRCIQSCVLIHYILVGEFLHDVYFLIDVFLQEWFLFDLRLGDDLDCEHLL